MRKLDICFRFLVLFMSGLLLFSCSDDKNPAPVSTCGPYAKSDAIKFDEAINSSSQYALDTAWISGQCISVVIESNCCGTTDNWEVELYDGDALAESFPPQRFLALDFFNRDFCEAICVDTFSFDLAFIESESYDTIMLNLHQFHQRLIWAP